MAWKLDCKGVTVYRYGSRQTQVLTTRKEVSDEDMGPRVVPIDYTGGCEKCAI